MLDDEQLMGCMKSFFSFLVMFYFTNNVLFYITLSYDDWESDSERWTTSPRPHVSFFFVFLAFYFFLTMFYRLLSAQ